MSEQPTKLRRWPQFSLLAVLWIMTMTALFCGAGAALLNGQWLLFVVILFVSSFVMMAQESIIWPPRRFPH